MLTEEQMTVSERRKYLKLMKARYVSANRAERGCLLTEMHQVTGLHRKSVIRLMHAASLDRKKRSRPRSRQYGLEVERVVVRIWESRDCQVPENLDTITRVDKGEFATPVLRHTGWENDSPNSHAGADGCRS